MSSHKTTFLLCLHTKPSDLPMKISTVPQPAPSRLSRMFLTNSRERGPQKQSTSFIDSLCPSCVSVFRSESIEPPEARLRVLEYRLIYQYSGRLRPVVAGNLGGNMVLISQDDLPTVDLAPADRPGFSIPRKPVPDRESNLGFWSTFRKHGPGPLSKSEKVYLSHLEAWWQAERNGERQRQVSFTRTTDDGSTDIIWPSFGRTLSGEFDLDIEGPPTPGPSRSPHLAQRVSQEETDLGTRPLSNPHLSIDRYFTIGDISTENPGPCDTQVGTPKSSDLPINSSERVPEEPNWRISSSPVGSGLHKQLLHAPGRAATAPDLDKPLPRIPRPDTPVPGAPFNNNIPDRDLPRNKYYPRFI